MNKRKSFYILLVIFLSLISGGIISHTIFSVYLSPIWLCIISLVMGCLLGLIANLIIQKFIDFVKAQDFIQILLFIFCTDVVCISGGLLSIPISSIPGWLGQFGPILAFAILFIINAIILSYRKDAVIEFANRITNGKIQISEVASKHEATALLDTSVIIDGRIADIAHCGFVPGILIVPGFILQELQFIADSEDAQRRQRGRRGLETLANMQKDKQITIQISEFDVPNIRETDAKLMHVALELHCPILTNDYNLNKVAELQGIRILNVNDLTNAVKSILLPGEKLIVNVIQEGKEINQGVGYMEDGTMVVVENGRPFLNQQIEVAVTKILQTAAGRMIFARHEKDLGVRR